MRVHYGVPLAVLLVLTGCGGQSAEKPGTVTTPSTAPSASSAALPDEGDLTLTSGASVHYLCTGQGATAILLESTLDSPGITSFGFDFVDPLAEGARVCTYDRPGIGVSGALPEGKKRTIDDQCDVQDEVRQKLGLSPAVLVGHGWGAILVIKCASRQPTNVAALVSIEGYHNDPTKMAPGEGPNLEQIDYVRSSALLDAVSRPIGNFPVLVISAADEGPSAVKNQQYWLGLSGSSRQVVLQSRHRLVDVVPEQVVAEIQEELQSL